MSNFVVSAEKMAGYFEDMKRNTIKEKVQKFSSPLIMNDEYEIHTFSNGIRLAHKQVPFTQIAHCGIMMDIGSRDESPTQQGLVHFWEHMAFKGTEKRRAHHIINSLEKVGGELNAYTTKEKICFHASVLEEHLPKAMDLLTDIAFHSVFPEKQIERERNVILEEMSMYYDSPEDAIQDDFDTLLFPDHALGYNILGTVDTVKSFSKEDLEQFINEHLDTTRIIISSVSKHPFSKVLKMVSKFVEDIPYKVSQKKRVAPTNYTPRTENYKRGMTQAQCAIGRPSYSLTDERRLPFFVLLNLLGGPGMNSRFNMALREKHGFVYSIDASYTPFLDTGYFGIYFGTEPRHLDKSIHLIKKELTKLKETPLTTLQLHNTQVQIMGQLAMAEESNSSYMLMMAKSLLDNGRVDSLVEIFDEIKGLTSAELQDLANEMFDDNQFSYLTFNPE